VELDVGGRGHAVPLEVKQERPDVVEVEVFG